MVENQCIGIWKAEADIMKLYLGCALKNICAFSVVHNALVVKKIPDIGNAERRTIEVNASVHDSVNIYGILPDDSKIKDKLRGGEISF